MIEEEMVGWHHQLNGHEFEQSSGDGEEQGSLACCSPWGQNVTVLSHRHFAGRRGAAESCRGRVCLLLLGLLFAHKLYILEVVICPVQDSASR